nr:cuticle collagen 7-like [Gorilla gorilla gorilla]
MEFRDRAGEPSGCSGVPSVGPGRSPPSRQRLPRDGYAPGPARRQEENGDGVTPGQGSLGVPSPSTAQSPRKLTSPTNPPSPSVPPNTRQPNQQRCWWAFPRTSATNRVISSCVYTST